MKSLLISLIYLSLIFAITHSVVMSSSHQLFQRYIGDWSPIQQAQPQINILQSYFLCQYAFRQMEWKNNVYSCTSFLSRFKIFQNKFCSWKTQTFYTMTNAFKATFCHYKDPNKKIQRIFQTGNTYSRNWRTYSCPQHQFISKIAPVISYSNGIDIGFIGLKAECQNIDLDKSTKIQDKEAIYSSSTSWTSNKKGTFVSGLSLKYLKGQKLTGVQFTFSQVPIISKITLYYDKTSAILTPLLIAANQLPNNSTKAISKAFNVKKQFMTEHSWNNDDNTLPKSFDISSSVKITQVESISGALFNDTRVNLNGGNFRFNQIMQIPSNASSDFIAVANPCQLIQLASYLIIQKMTVPYNVVLSFAGRYSKFDMGNSTRIKGVWTGTLPLTIKTQIIENSVKGCILS